MTNADKMLVALEDALILIYEKKISGMKDLLPILEQIAKMGRPLLHHPRYRRRSTGHPGGPNKIRGTLHVAAVSSRLRRPQ